MEQTDSVLKMWQMYHEFIGVQTPGEIVTDSFSDIEEEATELAQLVYRGVKRATASALWFLQRSGTEIPLAGGIFLVVDGMGEAVCIVKTKKVSIIPFSEITAHHAFIEGEGDKSLEHWRRVHIEYYNRQFISLDLTFDESMPIVFEEFEKVFP